jgi:superfamily II RNA helicase
MVKVCTGEYPDNSKMKSYFELYPYPLSDFQKYAIEAIVEGHHVLVTAHTGSGKTLPAEFAIQHFTKDFGKAGIDGLKDFINGTGPKKKVIYTSPIKALSNQKYYDFTKKYPDISFGLMTGDIKTNPDADVLIMTTEILMNRLFLDNKNTESSALSFQMDIQNDLACVIFDEVHYINDADRGQTWEKTILMLPKHIQMVMLSATIDNPERFALWCERGDNAKQVYLASTLKRVVPLSHYGYVAATEGFVKNLKDKALEKDVRENTQKLVLLQNDRGEFQDTGFNTLKRMTELFDKRQLFAKRKHILNGLALHLRDHDMLPAIGFVFSRKLVELCASEITIPLLEDDSKVGYNIRRECEQIVRKLPNAHEYLELPEYHQVVSLLEKGIGIHHSGMIPVLREIVELMITKKYIKFLFATESFAIGLDCPIKTAVFISLSKFDGHTERHLMSHEYTQMAGRAGRRGIDTIGHVVHCNNLFPFLTKTDYQAILCGKPQDLVSKFRISYSIILNLVKNGKTKISDFVEFVEKSMISQELAKEKTDALKSLKNLSEMYKRSESIIDRLQTPLDICNAYLETQESLKTAVNKKRKELERKMGSFIDQYRYIKMDVDQVKSFNQLKIDYEKEYIVAQNIETYIGRNVEKLCTILIKQGFLSDDFDSFTFTDKGSIASNIHEIHSLIFAQFLTDQHDFASYSSEQLIGLLACFTDVKVDEDQRNWYVTSEDAVLKSQLLKLHVLFNRYETMESDETINTGFDYKSALNYDMTDFAMEWAKCENETDCKYFIQVRLNEKKISVGDFVKAILKISTITKELSSVAEEYGKIELLNKLSKIDGLILKYVTMSQSLYV